MRRLFHSSGCEILRHCRGCYELRYLGRTILRCKCREMAMRYFCREFAPEDETR